MVLFVLCVKADLDGVSSMSLVNGANICLSVKNPLSDFEVREKIVLNTAEHVEQEENTREPPCHFALKWEGSKKRSTIEVLDEAAAKAALKKSGKKSKGGKGGSSVPREVTANDSGEYVPVLALECRGIEPYAFHPMSDEFVITSEGGTTFNEGIDLSDGDWADYDADNDISVSISNFQSKFVAV